MEIKVFSEETIKKFRTDKKFAIISILSPNREIDLSCLCEQENFIGILNLRFYDLDEDTEIFPYSKYIFKPGDAQDTLDFVELINCGLDILCIHCEAGISRSAGIAAALSKIYTGNDNYFFKHYCPNRLVYRTILNCYYEKDSNNA